MSTGCQKYFFRYVNMSVCQYVSMSICQYVNMSVCQYANMSICQYVRMQLFSLGIKVKDVQNVSENSFLTTLV